MDPSKRRPTSPPAVLSAEEEDSSSPPSSPTPATAAMEADAAAEADAADTLRVAEALRAVLLPCKNCRASRVKCKGGFPCARCYDRSVMCEPQARGADAVSGVGAGLGDLLFGGAEGACGGGAGDETWVGLAEVQRQAPSFMDLVYLSCDPLPLAEAYTRACVRVLEAGHCSRANGLRVLRMWRRESLRLGADVTMGAAKVLQAKLGVAPIELVDRDELLYGPTEAARRARLAAEHNVAQAGRARELREWDVFKRAALGGAGAFLFHVDAEGRCVTAGNPEFLRMVGGAGWPGRHMQATKMLSSFVAASLCAPRDRPLLLEAVAQNLLGDQSGAPRRITHIIKCYMGDGSGPGRVALAIMTLERVELADGSVGFVRRIEPAPPSRHLTARPPAEGHVVESGRKGYRKSTMMEASAATRGTGTGTGTGVGVGQGGPAAVVAVGGRGSHVRHGRGRAGVQQGGFGFPCIAAVPGDVAAAGGSGWDALAVVGPAEALVEWRGPLPHEQEQEQEQEQEPPQRSQPTQPSRKRARRSQPAASSGASAAGIKRQQARAPIVVQPPALPPGGAGAAGAATLYEGPFTLVSEDWPGFLEDEEELLVGIEGNSAVGYVGSPIAMEDVFK